MIDRLLRPRFLLPGRPLGVGLTVSALVHLASLLALVLLVARAGRSPLEGDGVEGDRLDVDTVNEPGASTPADPHPSPASTPQPRRLAAAPARTRSGTIPVTRPGQPGATVSRSPRSLAS